MDTNKIEKALLDRELKVISEKLEKIGGDIRNVFANYGIIQENHKKELHDYLVKMVLHVGTPFFAGYTTQPQTLSDPYHIPECVKTLILNWAVKDFLENVTDIQSVI